MDQADRRDGFLWGYRAGIGAARGGHNTAFDPNRDTDEQAHAEADRLAIGDRAAYEERLAASPLGLTNQLRPTDGQ